MDMQGILIAAIVIGIGLNFVKGIGRLIKTVAKVAVVLAILAYFGVF